MNDNKARMCRAIINDNLYRSVHTSHSRVPRAMYKKGTYCNNVNIGGIDSICTVDVIDKHPIEIAEAFTQKKGYNYLTRQQRPTIVQTIGSDFVGSELDSLKGIRDLQFVLRSNFAGMCKPNRLDELKHNECLFFPIVTVIRDMAGGLINFNELFSFTLILSEPLSNPEKLSESKFTIKDFFGTLEKIETVFQTAIYNDTKILIFSPYGLDDVDDNPPEDIIKIFNFCILKYGHRFQSIIFSMPSAYGKELYEMFDENIIKPNMSTKHIDKEYESRKMHFKLENLGEIDDLKGKKNIKVKGNSKNEELEDATNHFADLLN